VIEFTVPGTPVPQGSKTRTPQGGFREANKNLKPWRDSVAWSARAAMTRCKPLSGPVRLSAVFYFPRPQSHFRRVSGTPTLSEDAPYYCAKKPDTDKLVRAIGDAITGICFADDSQVVWIGAMKMYGDPRAEIQVWEIY
jgi:crossover junction endodeoxyribonuclease RusA